MLNDFRLRLDPPTPHLHAILKTNVGSSLRCNFSLGNLFSSKGSAEKKKKKIERSWAQNGRKMWPLYLLSWVAMILQIVFVTVAVAAGLYYLAELVEEYTTTTRKVIWWMTMVVLGIYTIFLLFEDLPKTLVFCGIISQMAHLCIIQTFPFFDVLSPSFVTTVVMLVVNHYLAFQHFSSHYFAFSEVLGYFTICLWLVPFTLFVSLSANENTLPTVSESRHHDDDVVSSYFSRKGKKYGLLAFFNYAKDSILPQRNKKGY
ncbi:protein TEX261 [Neocloeon triangulifer]|uniref:protein TEX261 n=1 Tax=Neocloeon triangulifer TaxID=2078957 RepID=UPI00286F7767|nr:protein TEX261 [Neocloeon triangulifer]